MIRRAFVLFLLLPACGDDSGMPSPMPDAAMPSDGAPGLRPRLNASLANKRFFVADHMRASIEMQISGEPFAQLLGYNLGGFDRSLLPTDIYTDFASGQQRTDPLGWILAVETYEYSKQPMNNLSFESGAGLSLQFGPILNPSGVTGEQAFTLLANRFQSFATASASGGPAGQNYITVPPPSGNPLNHYGWPGLWPVFAEFADFDPSITPVPAYTTGCSLVRGAIGTYGGGAGVPTGAVGNYECDYNSLNLPERDTHVNKVLSPDALGYSSWKQGLWVVNYWQSMHDILGDAIVQVPAGSRAMVGQAMNNVVGQYPDPNDPTGMTMLDGIPGTYLGDVPIEGWQGLLMLDENDNKSALLLGKLLSADGSTLRGATPQQAVTYAYDSPLLYFPSQVSVTETATSTDAMTATRYFPQPTAFAIADGSSRLRDLSGLIGGMAEFFAMTDANNSQVGGSDPFLATFDGDPLAGDDGMADGENSPHDRALGVLKIALVDLDRLHLDTTNHVLVDQTTVSGSTITRGTTATTVEVAESILALRNAYRALNSSLQLYSNDTPDTLGAPSALDSTPTTGAGYTGTLSSHIIALIRLQADFLSQKLVSSSGQVSNSYDLTHQQADSSATTLESETAAIRGLLDAYLATSDVSYRQTATTIYADLQQRFWQTDIRVYSTTAGDASHFVYTPIRMGLLSGALRQYYKLVASQPGREMEAQDLLAKLKRVYKLVVNGWDDVNQDDKVDYPAECTGAGLQLGERALTGEFANPLDMGDRDKDCVREISAVGLPAALGAELDLTRP